LNTWPCPAAVYLSLSSCADGRESSRAVMVALVVVVESVWRFSEW